MRPAYLLAVPLLIVACTSSARESDTVAAPPSRTAAAATAGFADWPMYHGSNHRLGHARTMPPVSGAPRVVKKLTLDGAVYAAPIVIGGVTVVATENDTVYAFSPTYAQLWKKHLGSPSPAAQRPCGDIDPLGTTGTPAYSSSTHLVYVAPEFSGSPPTHQLYALSLKTGAVFFHHSLDLSGVDRAAMQERGAVSLLDGRVYVPFGGLAGDCGAYKGRVVGYAVDGSGSAVSYTVPTAREAGIWTPPGPVADLRHDLYVAVGNGQSGVGDPYDHSDSVLKLSTSLKLLGSFSPTGWASENDHDLDLGSQGPAIVGSWIFQAGKSGTAYVLRQSHLGGIGGQVSKANICTSFGGTAVNGNVVYVPCTDGVRAVRIDSAGTMHVVWHAASNIAGSPVIGGGRIWCLDAGGGQLHALDPGTGASKASVSVGTTSRFATPALYGRNVYVPTLSGLTVVRTS
jgi:outer membrane protein assembly factor BamB